MKIGVLVVSVVLITHANWVSRILGKRERNGNRKREQKRPTENA